jgi:hypothetical protein
MIEQTLERIAVALERLAAMHAPVAPSETKTTDISDAAAKKAAQAAKVKAAAEKAAADKAAAEAVTTTTKQQDAEDTLPYDVLRANVIKLAACGSAGNAAAVKVLGEFKVKKASEAPATQWSAMNDRMLEEYAAINAPPAAESFA